MKRDLGNKINNRDYLKVFQDSDIEKEVISRVVKEMRGFLDEPLETRRPISVSTENSWIKKENKPRLYLEKLRGMAVYKKHLEDVIKEITKDFDDRRWYIEKLNIHQSVKEAVLNNMFEDELINSNLVKDSEGNLFIARKFISGAATDEIELQLILNNVQEHVGKFRSDILSKVNSLEINNIVDVQQASIILSVMNLYQQFPEVDIKFNNFFTNQFKLVDSLLKENIDEVLFIQEMEKLFIMMKSIIDANRTPYEE